MGRRQGLGGWHHSGGCRMMSLRRRGCELEPGGAVRTAGQSPPPGPVRCPEGPRGPGWLAVVAGELCQQGSGISCPSPQTIVPRPVPRHGCFLFLFCNTAMIIFNWTSEPHSKLFFRERLLQKGSNYRIITLMKDTNS